MHLIGKGEAPPAWGEASRIAGTGASSRPDTTSPNWNQLASFTLHSLLFPCPSDNPRNTPDLTGVRLRLDNELISFMITVSCVEKWCDAFEFPLAPDRSAWWDVALRHLRESRAQPDVNRRTPIAIPKKELKLTQSLHSI